MAWHDVFGTVVEEGDYILSSAASTGKTKVGTAYYAPSGRLMMNVLKMFSYGSEQYFPPNKRSEAGSNVVVLKTKDGTIPGPVQNLW